MREIEKVDFLILRFDWDTSRLKQSNDLSNFNFNLILLTFRTQHNSKYVGAYNLQNFIIFYTFLQFYKTIFKPLLKYEKL